MARSTSKNNSKLFIAIEGRSRDRLINKDLDYPLFCIFRISTTDPKTNNEILVYERKISIQANASEDGLQLHLSTLATTTYGYRLSAEATDNNQTKITSLASIALSPVGMIKANNPRHLNTIILKIKD
jgi:hypothetical protein